MMRKNTRTTIGIIVAVAAVTALYIVFDYQSRWGAPDSGGSKKTGETQAPASAGSDNMNAQNSAGGLKIETLKQGSGQGAKAGDTVTVHYVGTLVDGKKFDSSIDRGQPFSFTLGAGQVIAGWDQGIAGMKVGEERRLTIPPELGYGVAGAGGVIPPNATLIFVVEMLKISR